MGDIAAARRMPEIFASCGAESLTITKTKLEWPGHKEVKWGKSGRTRLVAAYINSPIGRSYMMSEKKQMTGTNVNASKLRSLPIALPSLGEQRHVLRELDDLQAQVDAIKSIQTETAAELTALMPAVLSKAFAGELYWEAVPQTWSSSPNPWKRSVN